ncbi:MAG: Gfo/Idh/MocA family protein [Promethearchaeota archaeon]
MLRVGLIGTGEISELNYLGYHFSPDAEIVAVANTNHKEAKQKLIKWGLRTTKIYTDYKKMVEREDLDIVDILTPHHLHAPMTEFCAKAGVSGISVQKPMAHNIASCEKMILVCKEENVTLRSFENFRFYPPYLKAKELLDQGIIGEPLSFRINTIGMAGPGWPRKISSLLWRINVEKCGGGPMVYDDGIHKFSAALWLMDQERVDRVYSWIDFFSGVVDGPANIIWQYPCKNTDEPPKFGTMEFSMGMNIYFPSNYYACDEFIEISGTKGIMWLNQCTSGGNIMSNYPQYAPIVVYVDGEAQVYGEDLPRDWRYSFINATQHFIKVINEGGEPVYNGEQGKNLCIFAKMPYISTQQKREVFWDEMTLENENNRSCAVKNYVKKGKAIIKAIGFLRKKSKDLKNGKKQGLKHTKFKYDYDLKK